MYMYCTFVYVILLVTKTGMRPILLCNKARHAGDRVDVVPAGFTVHFVGCGPPMLQESQFY
jgi:hypothetical protein